ncbi:Serpentine Receptor, class AB (Class A-like) [Caenorhabditis elegans]|uniref:Serpentine Receptor, class AB (Class A-like) n=1 Tax=Caenorhabditis elegans TaxID=6239 RepID=Q22383_CAEEL|nr:Serpentine Receptor, class AB (Class A-like) [Caenorhabditis elegans]CAA96683.2 Serpentine Receptor, class AB (Class A-like) [Caenorhabditis elegans]|eukprot:NP_505545.2 Serpentine Receptor, class AB (class A-like) [Caenorhabditis elegans]
MSNVDCNKMAEIASSGFLRFSLVFNLVITICAVPVLIWATWKLWSMKYTKLFHVNFKIIIQLHLFGFMLHCSGRIILHSIDLFNYTTQDNPCDMVPNIYRCFVLRLMYNTGLWITNSTAVSLIIERWLATKRSATYEQESVRMGIFLAFFQFAVTSIPLAVLYSKIQFEGVVMYYCVTAQASLPYVGQMSAVVGFVFQVSARISFHYLYKQNKHIRNTGVHHSTLSNRYQLEQNISSITCLKTFAGISTTFIVIYNIIYIVLMFHANDLEPYQYFGILELNLAFPSYAIVSIIILSRSMKKVRKLIGVQLVAHLKTPNQQYLDNFKRQIA